MTLGWVALLLLVAVAGSDAACEGDAPTAALLCHIESSLHPSTDPCLCTHMVVHNKGLLKDVELLKVKNPRLKILSVETSSKAELSTGLDGLYIHLEKPPTKEVLIEDLKALATSLDNIESSKRAQAKYGEEKEETANDGMEIIMELPSEPPQLAKHYDLKALTKYVNYFVVPSYNLTDSSEEGLAYHPSRLMGIDDILNADSLVDLLSSMGADHSQMILSLPAFALHFNLKNETQNMPRSPVSSEPKKLTQSQLCKMIEEGGWTLERDEDLTAPYAYKGKDWIAFDDTTSASIKGKYVLLRNLGGVSVAAAENDDWAHSCSGRPILDTLHNTLTNLARKSRAAQFLSLQDQIHNSLLPFAGDVHLSPFRIVRVVDRSGAVHVVRKEAKTEFECTRQGYFTHPSGCNRFYRCVKFNQYSPEFTVFEYDCPAGLAFDERYEVCVWPGSLPDASACKGSSEIAPVPRSRYACSTEGYYADPENCRWFFACLDHHRDGRTPPTAYEFRCPFGLVFDGKSFACDWPWKVPGCGSGSAAYATVGSGTLYPGDVLEGRLRPAYAHISDVHVSGGRIHGVDGGQVLGTTLLSGISSQTHGTYGGAYGSSGLSGYAGSQYEDQSGAYVHDPTGDTGGEYVHQDNPYIHEEGAQVPYIHQSDSGSYKGSGAYIHQGDGGAYVHQGDSGLYKGSGAYIHQGDGGDYVHQGDSGLYKGSGAYVHQGDSGSYGSGSYVHQGDSGAYVHQGDSGLYKGSGAYVHQGDSGSYASGGYYQSGKGYYGSGAYVHDARGDYYPNAIGSSYASKGSGLGAYATGGAYIHDSTGDSGGQYVHDGKGLSSYSSDVKTGGSFASINSGLGSIYTSGINSGAYVHDTKGDYDVKTSGGFSTGLNLDSGAYVHDTRGDYGGAYVAGNQGAYVHDNRGSYYGGKYVVGQGSQGYVNTGLYRGSAQYGSGAYVHDSRGDYGGGYYQQGYKVSVPNTYGIQVNQGHLYQPTAPIIHSYSPTKLSVQDHGYVQQSVNVSPITVTSAPVVPLKPVQYIQPQVRPVIVTTPSPQIVGYHYQKVPLVSQTPITVTSAPPLNPIQYVKQVQPVVQKIQPIVLSTPAPPVINYSYKQPIVSTVRPAISVSSTPVVPYNTVQYVSSPAPPVLSYHQPTVIKTEHIQSVSGYSYPKPAIKFDLPAPKPVLTYQQNYVSTPAPPVVNYSYKQPVVSTVRPAIAVSSTPVIPYNPVQYVSTPAPPVVSYHQPTVVQTEHIQPVSGYSYPKPAIKFDLPAPKPVLTYQQNFVSTPAPPVVNYSYKQPVISTVRPVSYNPIQYVSTPAPPVVSYHQPAVIKTEHIQPVSGYSYPKPAIKFDLPAPKPVLTYHQNFVSTPAPVVNYSYKQPVVSTVRPVSYNPVQYVSTPAPVVSYHQPAVIKTEHIQPVSGYSYPKPAIKFDLPAPKPVLTYQQNFVTTPAPPVVNYSYKQPVVSTVRPVSYNPVQYVSTPAPPVVSYHQPAVIKTEHIQPVSGYSYPKPAVKFDLPVVGYQQNVVSTPAPLSYTIKPISVSSTPVVPLNPVQYNYPVPCTSCAIAQTAKPITVTSSPVVQTYYPKVPQAPVDFAYKKPICSSCASAQTARPITVTSSPVVPLNPVQYISTPSPPVISYTYQKPVYKTQPIQPATFVSTPAPVQYESVYKYQPVQTQTIRPITVSSTPVGPLNPIQYKPAYESQTIIKDYQGYSYPKPSVKLELPEYRPVQQYVSTPAPVIRYQQPVIKQQVYTHPPAIVSYPQPTVKPVTVTSAPVVPYSPVQYVKPLQQFSYSFKPETQTVRPVTPPSISVSYSFPQVVKQTVRPVSYQPIRTDTYVSTPAPVVNYNYQPVVKTLSTPAPPVVSYSYQPPVNTKPVVPVQYVRPVEPKPVYSYTPVSTPAPVSYSYQPVTVTRKPVVPLNPVQYITPSTPAPVSYSYQPVKQTVRPYTVSTTAVPYDVQFKQEYHEYVKPQPFAVPAPVVKEYVKPESKPIFSFSYERPVVKTQVTTIRPIVSTTPVVPYNPVQYVRPAKPASFSYTYEAPSVHKEDYYYEEKVTPVTSTEVPYVEHQVRVKPTGFKTIVTEKPSIGTYFEEYFESNKNQDVSKGQYFGSSFSSQVDSGYKYEKPIIPVSKVNYGYENAYKEVHSSSFAPIVVPEVSTYRTVKKPVQTYVNTIEEENYYTSSISPDIRDENLNLHLDIPKVGVQLISSTTPEQIEVTSVAPVLKRVRVNGGTTRGGYYVRKQKVRVKPVVTTENYPAYFTTTVKPIYSSTIDLSSPTLYSTTVRPSTVAGAELEVEDEEDDTQLLKAVSGGYGEIVSSGDNGILRQGVSSTTLSSLKDGEAIVGVVKKEREPFTGRKKAKVVVVSRLSEFNPILVGKLGAECSCKSDTRTLDLSKRGRSRARVTTEPSRDYLPTSTTPLPADLTNFDYEDASPPTVEIKPVRKVQRVYSTSGPVEVSSLGYEVSTRPTRKISSGRNVETKNKINEYEGQKKSSGRRDESDIDCQRPGLFRHPHLCNKFYSCNWDEWKKRFTVSVFNCPIHLAFDSKLGACNWPSKGPKCVDNNLLV